MSYWLNLGAFGFNTVVTYTIGGGSIPAVTEWLAAKGLQTNREVSRKYPTMITPSGWAFAIWGPIYLLETATVLGGVYFCSSKTSASGLQAASTSFQLACIAQGVWAVLFGADQIILSTGMLGAITYFMFDVYTRTVGETDISFLPVRLGFAMHTTWLICAGLVSVNITAKSLGCSVTQQQGLVMVSELLGATVALYLGYRYRDLVPPLVATWALTAIAKNKNSVDTAIHVGASQSALTNLSNLGQSLAVVTATGAAVLAFQMLSQ